VDAYIALTSFARRKLIEGGIPESKIVVKPNFLTADPGVGEHTGRFALFVGRLTPEKGLETLLDAWARLDGAYSLKIVGGGPLEVLAATPRRGVEWLGRQPAERVLELMRDASILVFPSEWYEGFPMTLVEAFATGLPVVASALGSVAEIVGDHETGRLFAPGDSSDLAATVDWSFTHPRKLTEMSRRARREFEDKYTAERNYELLLDIYRHAMARL
jgi:glycosyltransferase involved in cell wall biosynthesis